MKQRDRVLLVALALALAFSLGLTACSGTQETETTVSSSSTPPSISEVSSEESTAADTVEDQTETTQSDAADAAQSEAAQDTAADETQETAPVMTGYLTEEEALEIAFDHAGLTADDVEYLECELDTDDVPAEYEIEFVYNGYEYECDIDAETGDILKYEREIAD